MLIDMVQEHMEDVSKVAAQLVSELAAQQSAACPSAEYQAWTPDVERALMLIRQCSDPAFKVSLCVFHCEYGFFQTRTVSANNLCAYYRHSNC